MTSLIRAALVWLLLAAGMAASPLAEPETARADDATVTSCTETAFDDALNAVQSSGGGNIIIECAGMITFDSEKTISTDVVIIGNGVTLDGGGGTRFFRVVAGASLALVDVTLKDGQGGAVDNRGRLVVVGSSFVSNDTGNDGGAIVNRGRLEIFASEFRENSANFDGGAIYSFRGEIDIHSTTFANNSADPRGIGRGGAISSAGAALRITASTFTANRSWDGGAIFTSGQEVVALTSVTFHGNVARSAASGGAVDVNNTLTIPVQTAASIFAANSRGTCGAAVTSLGSNLADTDDCGLTAPDDIENSASINLGALADNGGPTQTMLPGSGSDALDNADCALASATDQRGVVRPSSSCDIGAVEVGGEVPAVNLLAAFEVGRAGEGQPVPVYAVAENGGAELEFSFDCPGGATPTKVESSGFVTALGECLFADDGQYTVTLEACADGEPCRSSAFEISVDNLDPTITSVTNDGPVDEGATATVTVAATDPAGVDDPLSYSFDCDDDGSYETSGSSSQGSCMFADNGSFTIGVLVEDDDGGSATGSTTLDVLNVAPQVAPPVVDPSPSSEGESVVASATFTDPGAADTHTCTVDYGDGSGLQTGGVVGDICTGPAHTYLDDDPSGTASDTYTVTVMVTDDGSASGSNSAGQTVDNLPPVIDSVTSSGPVAQGQPVTLTVAASDAAGSNDPLTYAFDCDDDGVFETPGNGNRGQCGLDPANATSTIGVQVSDDDLGVTTGSVEVGQTLALCGGYQTGALSTPTNGGGCPAGSVPLVLPAASPVTLCVGLYNGGLLWAPSGQCGGGYWPHIVPTSGPLDYCQSLYTGKLRYSVSGQCSWGEWVGVIPG